ncbi:MAG: universal stress protein [Deltaproteobacteria bacterium]|nr:universal stress protein [Deltaproteobacteria bacterium]
MNIKTILAPVDGSDHSKRSAAYAADLAKALGGEIILMHCHRRFPSVLGEPYYQKVVDGIIEDANELLEPYRQMLREAGVPFTERILERPAGGAILEVAKTEGCDMVVMGSRGRTDLEGLLLGSVTHRVLEAAPCPVLVVR